LSGKRPPARREQHEQTEAEVEAENALNGICGTIQNFFLGMHHGDVNRLREALHPEALLWGYYMGEFYRQSVDDWMQELAGMDKPAQSGEPFDMRIVSIDVTGRAATVKTATLYQGLRFTDYLTLTRFDDGWKIVNKGYHHD
jgi:hypothetical protein